MTDKTYEFIRVVISLQDANDNLPISRIVQVATQKTGVNILEVS